MNPPMKCPLCYSAAEFFLAGDKREYWLCGCCRLVFVPSRFFISEEDEKQRYLEHNNSLESEGYVKMFQEKIDVIKKVCSGVETVLDYGCGYEPVLQTLLARKGYRVEAYDRFFFPDANLAAAYDLIVSTETFEHFKEPGKELAGIVSRLSPRGFLAVMTRLYPARDETICRETFANWYYKRDPTHIAFYGSETWKWLAKELNLKILFNDEKDFIVLQKGSSSDSSLV